MLSENERNKRLQEQERTRNAMIGQDRYADYGGAITAAIRFPLSAPLKSHVEATD